jgi:hypothetical protein
MERSSEDLSNVIGPKLGRKPTFQFAGDNLDTPPTGDFTPSLPSHSIHDQAHIPPAKLMNGYGVFVVRAHSLPRARTNLQRQPHRRTSLPPPQIM